MIIERKENKNFGFCLILLKIISLFWFWFYLNKEEKINNTIKFLKTKQIYMDLLLLLLFNSLFNFDLIILIVS